VAASLSVSWLIRQYEGDTMTDTDEKLESLRRQLKAARENLLLVQERKAEYVLSTNIPLDLVKEERRLKREIADLEQQISDLETTTEVGGRIQDKALVSKSTEPAIALSNMPITIPIPAGPFLMGSAPDDAEAHDNEKPRRKLDLQEYQIGCYPVTNTQYACFISDTGHNPPDHWDGGNVPAGLAGHPVVNVSFEDAEEYCRWLSEMAGQRYRLPTEEEWEKAARGGLPETRRYPWGDEWQPGFCNTQEVDRNGTTPVHEFERVNRSPFGVVDMVGNVWEWTASSYEAYAGSQYTSSYLGRLRCTVRGGAWKHSRWDARISCRGRYEPDQRRPYLGFRIVLDY
jgi:formylglycine-generating enzyme required for sulfatase activity